MHPEYDHEVPPTASVTLHGSMVDLDALSMHDRAVVIEAAAVEDVPDMSGPEATADTILLVIPPTDHITTADLKRRYGSIVHTVPNKELPLIPVPGNHEILELLAIKAAGQMRAALHGAGPRLAGDAEFIARGALAKDILYSIYVPLIRSYSRRRRMSYDDVTSESNALLGLVELIENETLQGRRADYHFTRIAYGTARHKIADGYRESGRNRSEAVPDDKLLQLAGTSGSQDEWLAELEPERLTQNKHLRLLLGALTTKQRAVLVLREINEMSAAAVAREVKSTEGAVRVSQHRILAGLRSLIYGEGDDVDELSRRISRGDRLLREQLLAAAALKISKVLFNLDIEALGRMKIDSIRRNSNDRGESAHPASRLIPVELDPEARYAGAMARLLPPQVLSEPIDDKPTDHVVGVNVMERRLSINGVDIDVSPNEAVAFNSLMLVQDDDVAVSATDLLTIAWSRVDDERIGVTEVSKVVQPLVYRINEAAGAELIRTEFVDDVTRWQVVQPIGATSIGPVPRVSAIHEGLWHYVHRALSKGRGVSERTA